MGGTPSGFPVFGGKDPVVCLTESTWSGFKFLVGKRGYQPWGLIIDRESVYRAGGGPVWYARSPEYDALGQLNPHLRSWAVELGRHSDWLEEREWRIVLESASELPPAIPLSKLKLVGLLVGDPQWTAPRPQLMRVENGQNEPEHTLPPWASNVPRYRWDPSTAKLHALSPLSGAA